MSSLLHSETQKGLSQYDIFLLIADKNVKDIIEIINAHLSNDSCGCKHVHTLMVDIDMHSKAMARMFKIMLEAKMVLDNKRYLTIKMRKYNKKNKWNFEININVINEDIDATDAS
jgi:hypothetical protein